MREYKTTRIILFIRFYYGYVHLDNRLINSLNTCDIIDSNKIILKTSFVKETNHDQKCRYKFPFPY